MVKIEIGGEPLVLYNNQNIRFKMRNPMMYEDVLPKYYTFPFTIPLETGKNSFLLHYPQLWKNTKKLTGKIDCNIFLFGQNNPRKSLLNINTAAEDSAECNFVLDRNVDDIGDKNLRDIDMDTIVLEDTVYCEQFIEIFKNGGYTPTGNFELTLNNKLFTSAQIAYTGPDYFLAVYIDLVSQINTAALGVTATVEDPFGTGVYFLGLKSDLPGTQNAFKITNLQSQLDAFNLGSGNYAWQFFQGSLSMVGAEFHWIDEHLLAVRNAVCEAITVWNPDTTLVTFPVIENVAFIDDENYKGFQNSYFYDGTSDRNSLNFLTPMPHLVYVIKKVFKALGFEANGSFLEDESIKRWVLYSNVACDYFQEIHDTISGATPPDYAYPYFAKQVNIHASVIDIAKHCPDISVKEFLTEIRKTWNLRYDYDYTSNTVKISIAQDEIDNQIQSAPDYTKNIVNKWLLQNPNSNADTVKLFKFEEDSSDDKLKQLGPLDYQLPLIVDKNAIKEIIPKISSICEEKIDNFTTVAAIQLSGYYNNQGSVTKMKILQYFHQPELPEDMLLPTWAVMQLFFEFTILPFALNKDSYSRFTYVSTWSLRWDTDKGFYKKCWERQTAFLNNGVQLKIAMTFSDTELADMQKKPFHNLDGSIAIWKDIDVVLSENDNTQAECIYQLV